MAARSLGEPVAARSLAGRAAVAVALLVGFYALALGIAGALLWVPWAEWHYGGRIHLKLGAGCAFGALAILWSLVPRRDAFEPPGPRLERADHPALFGALDRVAAKVGQALPREVFLEPDLNAWVASRGGAMGFGSHRVMGIGLPLLQVVDVPAFEAILAHEFGHYHGGDTRLGPWIYKTRAAIGRTLDALHGGWLQAPFRWYGNAFLRITQGISRAQEFTADRLAAVAIGAAPLARGLRAVHAYAGAFHAYWQSEALPVLRAGFHAPLTEGFASFVRVPHVESAVRDDLASALRAGDAHEFDSHPPLGERIAALGELAAEADAAAPRALSLLGDVVAVEQALLAFLGGRETRFSPVAWSEVPEQVFLPAWRRQRAELGAALGGLTWGALPEALRTRGPELARAVHGLPAPVAEDEVAPALGGPIGCCLAVALVERGWSLSAGLGDPVSVSRGALRLEPFALVAELRADPARASRFAAFVAEAGLDRLAVAGAPAPEPAVPGAPTPDSAGVRAPAPGPHVRSGGSASGSAAG